MIRVKLSILLAALYGCSALAQGNLSANPYDSSSTSNPYATDTPKLYDSQGGYRGKLSTNPYDPESTSNLYGRYGSPYSTDSINNPYGAGSPYRTDSPKNPYGKELKILGQ